MAKKQEAAPKKVKKQHKVKAAQPLLPRAVRLEIEHNRKQKETARAAQAEAERVAFAKVQAAAAEVEHRRVKEACENWIQYWKYVAVTYGFCELEQFEKPQPEVLMAIDRLFNYGDHHDPRPGIELLIGEEYFGQCVNGRYFIAHNEYVSGSEGEE